MAAALFCKKYAVRFLGDIWLNTDLYLADFFKADETVIQILKIRKSFRWAVKMTDLADGKDAASPSWM